MESTWETRMQYFWRHYLRPFLIIAIVLTAFRSSVVDWNDVPSSSMKPTIIEGDRIFVNKLAYDLKAPYTLWRIAQWSNPKRGDIVVFFSPADNKRLVKRVMGLPGDVLEMRDDRLFINGEAAQYGALDQQYVNQIPPEEQPEYRFATETIGGRSHPVMRNPSYSATRGVFGPVQLKKDQYWMLGDNRDNSADSRVFGPVSRELIVGRTSAIAISLDFNNYFLPRWKRFFKALP